MYIAAQSLGGEAMVEDQSACSQYHTSRNIKNYSYHNTIQEQRFSNLNADQMNSRFCYRNPRVGGGSWKACMLKELPGDTDAAGPTDHTLSSEGQESLG